MSLEHRFRPFGAPHHALLHPLWIAALVVLVLNDHVLKGAELLPAIVTGKLSDVAGLLVAPLLLAAITGVRSRAGWRAAHLAVGAVFTAIQLSPAAADGWAALMAAIGFPWVITSDPTDLAALPMLLVSERVFPSAMVGSVRVLARRSAELGLGVVGLVSSAATSRPHEPSPTWLPPIYADVFVHNDTEEDIVLRIRRLASETEVACDIVAEDPARLLPAAAFGPIESWTLPPDANLAVLEPGTDHRPCHAVEIDGDALFSFVVFWRDGLPAPDSVPGIGLDEDGPPGWLAISADEAGTLSVEGGMPIIFRRKGGLLEPGGACAAQDDGARVAWDAQTLPRGIHALVGLERGIDGCVELALANGPAEPIADRTFVCMPNLELPFAIGDDVDIQLVAEPAREYLHIRAMQDGEPATPPRELIISRGKAVPDLRGVSAALIESFDCELSVDTCGTVARSAELVLGATEGETTKLAVNDDPVTVTPSDGIEVSVALAHAQNRYVVVDGCAEGAPGLGYDVEVVATVRAGE